MLGRDKLERRLRAERPRPDDEFLRSLTGRIDEDRTTARRPSSRVGLALAVAMVSLVAAGATGGLTYAADAVGHASTSLAHTLKSATGSDPSTSSSASVNSSLASAASTQSSAAGYYCFKTTNGNSYREIYISYQWPMAGIQPTSRER